MDDIEHFRDTRWESIRHVIQEQHDRSDVDPKVWPIHVEPEEPPVEPTPDPDEVVVPDLLRGDYIKIEAYDPIYRNDQTGATGDRTHYLEVVNPNPEGDAHVLKCKSTTHDGGSKEWIVGRNRDGDLYISVLHYRVPSAGLEDWSDPEIIESIERVTERKYNRRTR
jgi:hypothetical protein